MGDEREQAPITLAMEQFSWAVIATLLRRSVVAGHRLLRNCVALSQQT